MWFDFLENTVPMNDYLLFNCRSIQEIFPTTIGEDQTVTGRIKLRRVDKRVTSRVFLKSMRAKKGQIKTRVNR